MNNCIVSHYDEHVATIIIDRKEKLNAFNRTMTNELKSALSEMEVDDNIRAVILTGSGTKAFCCGSDIHELDEYQTAWKFRLREDYCDAIRQFRKPIIAAINGYALGGGLELALSCDIRIASSTARFGAPEIKLGWVGGGGMSAFLFNSIGQSNAAYMILTGDPINAEQALSWGLITQIEKPETLLAKALELADRISTRAPIAAQTAKANLRAAQAMPLEAAIQYERDLQTICMSTEDATEGRRAFAEKRPADFQGR